MVEGGYGYLFGRRMDMRAGEREEMGWISYGLLTAAIDG